MLSQEQEMAKKQFREFKTALRNAQPPGKALKWLLPHEKKLYKEGKLQNITHRGAKAVWLEALSNTPEEGQTIVYRHMGVPEVLFLVEHGVLPDTQPYQAIMEGALGRWYANKYLIGQKWTDTHPCTIVEFTCPSSLIATLKEMQTKIEDGTVSMGLGDKAGKGLPLFNKGLASGEVTFRIVKVVAKENRQPTNPVGGNKQNRK